MKNVQVFVCAGRCAAVLFTGEQILYTDGLPAPEIMEKFSKRSDNQITTLEVLAIAIGLSTFGDLLANRRVIIFSDNKGAEGSVRNGASKAWDQSMLIHEIWTLVGVRLGEHAFLASRL